MILMALACVGLLFVGMSAGDNNSTVRPYGDRPRKGMDSK